MSGYIPSSNSSRTGSESPPPPPTVIECFDTPLPELKASSEDNYRSVGAPSTTTANTTPPKVLLCRTVDHLKDTANQSLTNKRVLTTKSGTPRIATTRHTATDFRSWDKRSEQDIVSASSVSIMEPINEILQVLYPKGWEVSTECTDSRLNKVSRTQDEGSGDEDEDKDEDEDEDDIKGQRGGNKKRKKRKGKANVKSKEEPGHKENLIDGEKGKAIAIIEFKKPHQIRYKDFEPLRCTQLMRGRLKMVRRRSTS